MLYFYLLKIILYNLFFFIIMFNNKYNYNNSLNLTGNKNHKKKLIKEDVM